MAKMTQDAFVEIHGDVEKGLEFDVGRIRLQLKGLNNQPNS